MNKKITSFLLLIALVGVFFSGLLLKQHLTNIATGFEEKSFCNINEVINCDRVDASIFSQVRGIPVSGISLFFYLIITLFILNALVRNKSGSAFFAYLLVIVGALYTLRMAYLSFVTLKVACIFCIGLYIVIFTLCLLFPLALGGYGRLKELFEEYFSLKLTSSFLPHALISFLIMGIGVVTLQSKVSAAQKEWANKRKIEELKKNPNREPLSVEDIITLFFEQPQIDFDLTGRPAKGNTNSKVSIVEFSDFECPYCKKAAESFKKTMEEYKDDVAFYFFNYPLDKSCNKYMQRDLHKSACQAAFAAVCAGEQDKFWPYHDEAFANQPKYEKEDLNNYAQKIGLDIPAFESCLNSPQTMSKIQNDIEAAQKAGIQGTPSVFLNGRKLNGWNNEELLKGLLDESIKRTN